MSTHSVSSVRTSEWEDVYNVTDDEPIQTWPEEGAFYGFQWFQTYGGGPAGGYLTNGRILIDVHMTWDGKWFKTVPGKLEFKRGNSFIGQVAQCRIVYNTTP